jgi:hypothetical protein
MNPRVLERDRNGREILWQCSECGKPFSSGWGTRCNSCIARQNRHAELIEAIKSIPRLPATERGDTE